MTPEQIADLRAKAEAATPGPWARDKPGVNADGFRRGIAVAATYGRQMIYANPPGGQYPSADADFIAAANPAVMIELLAELSQATTLNRTYAEHARERTMEIAVLRARVAKIGGALKALLETCDNWETIPDGSPIYPMIGIDLPELCALRAAFKETGND
jgi:hypothetical protein